MNLRALEAEKRKAIEAFVARVNARAEAEMLSGKPITGAHHRALECELALLRCTTEPTKGPESND